nr:MAG TPA: hypothetical protein [Caudoviricetes sp.]
MPRLRICVEIQGLCKDEKLVASITPEEFDRKYGGTAHEK